jgi:hypothetical protein
MYLYSVIVNNQATANGRIFIVNRW